MSDKLAVQFYVTIGGRTYRNGAEPGIPFEAWVGWEEEPLVKVFEGELVATKLRYQLTQ